MIAFVPLDPEQNRQRKASARVASEARRLELDSRREGGTVEFGGSVWRRYVSAWRLPFVNVCLTHV